MSKQSALEEIIAETLESIEPGEQLSGRYVKTLVELIGNFAVKEIRDLESQLSEVALGKLSEMRGIVVAQEGSTATHRRP